MAVTHRERLLCLLEQLEPEGRDACSEPGGCAGQRAGQRELQEEVHGPLRVPQLATGRRVERGHPPEQQRVNVIGVGLPKQARESTLYQQNHTQAVSRHKTDAE